MRTKAGVIFLALLALLLGGCLSAEKTAPAATPTPVIQTAAPKQDVPKATATPTPKAFDPADVPLHAVESSAISEAGYDRAEHVLVIRFKESGIRYCYYDVPLSVYDELINAESIGRYFNQSIKGKYEYQRLD